MVISDYDVFSDNESTAGRRPIGFNNTHARLNPFNQLFQSIVPRCEQLGRRLEAEELPFTFISAAPIRRRLKSACILSLQTNYPATKFLHLLAHSILNHNIVEHLPKKNLGLTPIRLPTGSRSRCILANSFRCVRLQRNGKPLEGRGLAGRIGRAGTSTFASG